MNPIVNGLIKLAIALGKWILDVASRRGGKWLSEYLDERADSVFANRLYRARERYAKSRTILVKRRWERRIEWLVGRIARWKAAAKWLRAKAAQLDDAAIKAACSLPQVKALPLSAACEEEPA